MIEVRWYDNDKMIQAMRKFKEAAEKAWEILEGYGVTVQLLEEVKADIDAGKITKRSAWAKLGLPIEDYPGGNQ